MLELLSVAKIYGARLIFKDVSFHCAGGTVSLLAGDNGAGKSTLLRIMAGLSQPTAGTVTRNFQGMLGYLGHATFLYPGLTALENLLFWRDACGLRLSAKQLMDGLARVRLEAYAHQRAGVFSRGMAQRLNLARVLLQEPQALLLDEPCAGLDVASQAMLRQEILQARQRGACVVIISHNLAADAALADRLLVLQKHRLFYDGSPEGFCAGTADCPLVASLTPRATPRFEVTACHA